jgi:hypothetical protein
MGLLTMGPPTTVLSVEVQTDAQPDGLLLKGKQYTNTIIQNLLGTRQLLDLKLMLETG